MSHNFVQAPTAATGSLQYSVSPMFGGGDYFTLSDGVVAITFTFFNMMVPAGYRGTVIDTGSGPGQTGMATRTAACINALAATGRLKVTATANVGADGLVTLVADVPGTDGNVLITKSMFDAGFLVTGMSAGTGTAPAATQAEAVSRANDLSDVDPMAAAASLGAGFVVVNQVAHGFVAGNVLKRDGGAYAAAQANTRANSDPVVGLVAQVVDADNFILAGPGTVVRGLGFAVSDNTTYFLSDVSPGSLTSSAPTTAGTIRKTIAVGIGSGVAMVVIGDGIVVAGTSNLAFRVINSAGFASLTAGSTQTSAAFVLNVNEQPMVVLFPPSAAAAGVAASYGGNKVTINIEHWFERTGNPDESVLKVKNNTGITTDIYFMILGLTEF